VYALNEVPSEEALQTVITASKCEFIWEFKKGLQTEIGERGVRLS
jgi:ABC-type bacteriocin/lantibiotic exporter with double-glycine peptidase domain